MPQLQVPWQVSVLVVVSGIKMSAANERYAATYRPHAH
jgi:hypothetical protein